MEERKRGGKKNKIGGKVERRGDNGEMEEGRKVTKWRKKNIDTEEGRD